MIKYGYETFQNVKPVPLNQIAKTSSLELNLSLISNKVPNLHYIQRKHYCKIGKKKKR